MSKTKSILLTVLLVLGLAGLGLTAVQQAKPAGYHLINKMVIGGEGGWDYMTLDVQTRLLYVTHGNAVEIVNVDTGAKSDPIANLKGVHGVAFAPDRGRGYISNGRGNSVSVFDLKTGKVLEEIPSSGQNPDAIMYDAFSGRVFTFNGRSANATAIDAATSKVVGTIDIGGKPEFAVTDGKGMIFVNNEDKSEIVAFDAKSLEVKKRWPIAPGEGPSGLAIDLKNKRLFSVCDKVMVVSDYENGKVVTTVPIGGGPDAVRYDAGTGLVFASNGEGTLTVIRQESADKYSVLETVTTARGARTMELDPQTHHVFVVTAEYGPAPAPTTERPKPRPTIIPGSFKVLEYDNAGSLNIRIMGGQLISSRNNSYNPPTQSSGQNVLSIAISSIANFIPDCSKAQFFVLDGGIRGKFTPLFADQFGSGFEECTIDYFRGKNVPLSYGPNKFSYRNYVAAVIKDALSFGNGGQKVDQYILHVDRANLNTQKIVFSHSVMIQKYIDFLNGTYASLANNPQTKRILSLIDSPSSSIGPVEVGTIEHGDAAFRAIMVGGSSGNIGFLMVGYFPLNSIAKDIFETEDGVFEQDFKNRKNPNLHGERSYSNFGEERGTYPMKVFVEKYIFNNN